MQLHTFSWIHCIVFMLVSSIRRDVDGHHFVVLALDIDLEWATANLAIRREPLARQAGVDLQVARASAERTLYFF